MISDDAKKNMITQQLRTGDVLNEKVLQVYAGLNREDFVPSEMRPFAYSDLQIPLGHEQRMLTPLEEGKILQALELQGHETVLEIGTGSGFMSALLAQMAEKVISVEYYADFTQRARNNLKQAGIYNVELIHGDGSAGWMEKAPYDVIVFTGAIDAVSEGHKLQLMPGGKLFAVVGQKPIMQGQLHQLNQDGHWSHQLLFESCLPPLINKLRPKAFIF
ncbi:MAG: protein-L-isoaspartate O-methyltransferase [Legionellaceae bacterium]|nr:protein-L-isoaspartate O-methyltransferase [Legionellaceae bacterium]